MCGVHDVGSGGEGVGMSKLSVSNQVVDLSPHPGSCNGISTGSSTLQRQPITHDVALVVVAGLLLVVWLLLVAGLLAVAWLLLVARLLTVAWLLTVSGLPGCVPTNPHDNNPLNPLVLEVCITISSP